MAATVTPNRSALHIGMTLRRIRQQRNLSHGELAANLQMSEDTLHRLERGEICDWFEMAQALRRLERSSVIDRREFSRLVESLGKMRLSR